MKVHERRVGLLVLAISATLAFTGATWPLNPLVTRTDRPAGEVPANCNESLAPPPAPRVDIAQIPEPEILPASIPAPPSRSLRSELEASQTALVRNDRPAFDTHFANAREILRDYPSGAERTAAEDAVRAFDDAAKIWDAQFESPFFDQSSDAYARASRYPGYAEAVRRGVFTDDADRRFYPAAESREFVARAAAERLTRLGIRTPTMRARTERPTLAPTAAPTIARGDIVTSSPGSRRLSRPKSSGRSSARTTRATPRRKSSSTSSLAKSGKSAAPAPKASPSPDPSTPATAVADPAPAAPTVTAPTPVPTASPVAEGSPTTETADVVPTDTETAFPTDTTSTLPTTTTAAPVTPSGTVADTAATPAERRSVIVPALLILIGLGVLIVLFRASK